jgi:HD-GYP domain-containing protein (c-di-GMP phosphodiesterase class II)
MDFVPIRLSTLKPGVDLPFDIYIKLKTRYLMYMKGGDDINESRIDNLKTKKIKQLFINCADELRYQGFLDDSLLRAATSNDMSASEKADVATGVASAAIEDMKDDPHSQASYRMAQRAAKGIVQIICKNSDVLKNIFARESDQDLSVKHAVNVSSLSIAMGQAMGLDDEKLENIGIAGLLHDIGQTKMSEDAQLLFEKKYEDFTQDDWKLYKPHPSLGCELLKDKPYVNAEILEMILNHEERKSGTGFPRGVRITSLSQEIVALCSLYDRHVTYLKKPHKQTIKDMMIDELGNFDFGLMNKFKEVIRGEKLGEVDAMKAE